jgi:hypothetical protein
MSMPQPVIVAIIGATNPGVRTARNYCRLGRPGLGPPLCATLAFEPEAPEIPIESLPIGTITIWLCLDSESFVFRPPIP